MIAENDEKHPKLLELNFFRIDTQTNKKAVKMFRVLQEPELLKKRGGILTLSWLQTRRKRRKSARTNPTPHHTSLEERSALVFIPQPLSALHATAHPSAPSHIQSD